MKVDALGKLVRVGEQDLDDNGRFVCDSNIVTIGANAFFNAKFSLKAVEMKNVEKICQFAFTDCSELEYVGFSPKLSQIDYGAFMGCYKLHEVIFPKSLQFLGHWAFLGCESLKKVEFLGDLLRIDNSSENQACDFLANDVFDKCKYIEKFVFHKNFAYHQGIKKFKKLKEIQICDKDSSKLFWRELLYDSPQAFMLLDSKSFFNADFVKNCIIFMEQCFEGQFGCDEKLSELLVSQIFEQKLLLEEKKCFQNTKNF